MQQTSVTRAGRYLVLGLALVSACALLACTDEAGERRDVRTTVPVTRGLITALQGQVITIPNGAIFSAEIGNNPVILLFNPANNFPRNTNTTTTFSLTRTDAVATGTVNFGSCDFAISEAGLGLQIGQTVAFPTCLIRVSADDVEVGGIPASGVITLVLMNAVDTVTSTPLTASVGIRTNGLLRINNVDTSLNTNALAPAGTSSP